MHFVVPNEIVLWFFNKKILSFTSGGRAYARVVRITIGKLLNISLD